MKVSLLIREGSGNDRRYSKFNKKKISPEGTVFCLRYQRKIRNVEGHRPDCRAGQPGRSRKRLC
jgi:hypothetical protein